MNQDKKKNSVLGSNIQIHYSYSQYKLFKINQNLKHIKPNSIFIFRKCTIKKNMK